MGGIFSVATTWLWRSVPSISDALNIKNCNWPVKNDETLCCFLTKVYIFSIIYWKFNLINISMWRSFTHCALNLCFQKLSFLFCLRWTLMHICIAYIISHVMLVLDIAIIHFIPLLSFSRNINKLSPWVLFLVFFSILYLCLLLQLWDVKMNSGPVATFQVHEYLRPKVISSMLSNDGSLRTMNSTYLHWSKADQCVTSWNCSYVIYMKMTQFLTNLSVVKVVMD